MITIESLLKRQVSLFPQDDLGFIFPDYSGCSLTNLAQSICKWLGQGNSGENGLDKDYPLLDEKFDRVILILMDGLGWLRLRK